MRRIFRPILTLSAIMVVLAAMLPAVASPEDESQFVALINQSRTESGLTPLDVFWDLADDADVHTAEMIAAGQIYHSSNAQLGSYATGWARLGENVGMGPNPSLLHQAFLSSASHRANILGDYDLVGVGADRAQDGTMFVTVVFMKSAAQPTTTTTAPSTTAPSTTAPPTTTPPTTAPPATAPPTTTPPPATAPPATAPPTTAAPTTTSNAADEAATTGAFEPTNGERPATKAAGAITERRVVAFRPVFGLLETTPSDPIVVLTSNGFRLVIE
jgi:uncharacterized protein YkwD